MSPSTTLVPAIAAALALSALAACSASSGGSAASSSPGDVTPPITAAPSTSTPATTRTETQTTTVAPSSSASSATGTKACTESQLREAVTAQSSSGTNRHVVRITIENKSTSSCTLTGYPGAAIVDDSGKQVQQAKRVLGGPIGGTVEKVATLTVAPGSSAFAYLEGLSTQETGAAQAGCEGPKFPRILVTPPNTKTPVPFTIGWPQCYAFDVHPMRLQ